MFQKNQDKMRIVKLKQGSRITQFLTFEINLIDLIRTFFRPRHFYAKKKKWEEAEDEEPE